MHLIVIITTSSFMHSGFKEFDYHVSDQACSRQENLKFVICWKSDFLITFSHEVLPLQDAAFRGSDVSTNFILLDY